MDTPTHASHRGPHSVKAEAFGRGVRLLLDHPDALNSLDLAMVEELEGHLKRLGMEPECGFLVLDSPPGRAFCAGGDVKMIHDALEKGDLASVDSFFATEYKADLAIHGFPTPVAAIADGICMGGGLGLCAGADVVIATENTVMAMPEARIGFFPDVLATRWLSDRCPPGFGEYLALTAASAAGPACVSCGLATHYVPSEKLPRLREVLAELPSALFRSDFLPLFTRAAEGLWEAVPPMNKAMLSWLHGCFFEKASVEEIRQALEKDAISPLQSREALARMEALCPTSLALTHALLKKNRTRPFPQVAASDRAAAAFMTRRNDYVNGVRARLLTKGREPAWDPARLSGVRLPEDF